MNPTSVTKSAAVTILTNDKAGALHATASVDDLRSRAAELELDANVIGTHSPEEMREQIRALVSQGADRIAVAGGDGTVHLAVQELAGTETALGIIPQGTANNFATAMRLPQDLPSAMRVLKTSKIGKVDLGFACDHYFTESAGVGLFANALSFYGPNSNKNFFRAFYAIFKLVFSMQASRIKLVLDGEEVEQRAVMCTVANTYRLGYGMAVAPDAKATDGKFEVVVLGNLSRSELIGYYRAIRAQSHLSLPKVKTFKAQRVSISSRRRMPVHCDDRVICNTPVTIECKPAALNLLLEEI